MTNHSHFVLEAPEAILSRGMRQLNSVYTQARAILACAELDLSAFGVNPSVKNEVGNLFRSFKAIHAVRWTEKEKRRWPRHPSVF